MKLSQTRDQRPSKTLHTKSCRDARDDISFNGLYAHITISVIETSTRSDAKCFCSCFSSWRAPLPQSPVFSFTLPIDALQRFIAWQRSAHIRVTSTSQASPTGILSEKDKTKRSKSTTVVVEYGVPKLEGPATILRHDSRPAAQSALVCQ